MSHGWCLWYLYRKIRMSALRRDLLAEARAPGASPTVAKPVAHCAQESLHLHWQALDLYRSGQVRQSAPLFEAAIAANGNRFS